MVSSNIFHLHRLLAEPTVLGEENDFRKRLDEGKIEGRNCARCWELVTVYPHVIT